MRQLALFTVVVLLAAAASATDPECGSDLTLLGFQADWNQLEAEIDNPGPTPQSGGMVVEFVMNGQSNQWWFGGITVPAHTRWDVTIGFPATIGIIGLTVCDAKPDGIIDAPDPVANKMKQKQH